MTYGYKQLSLTGHAQVLKVVAYGTNGLVRKRKDKNRAMLGKNKEWIGQASPYKVIPSQKQSYIG